MAFSYLALGDSYTIGEQVPLFESFPYQALQLLRNNGHDFHAPEILAKTGWTTDELLAAINEWKFREKYDLVTLLIGVNNQYRGRPVENYRSEFETLLNIAISHANSIKNVFVISIPDWGVTPFAKDRDAKQIAMGIDDYNTACEEITLAKNANFIEITQSYRDDAGVEGFLAGDGLHPSGKEYKKWAEELVKRFLDNG